MKLTLVILGAAMIGFQIPEIAAYFSSKFNRVEIILNLWWAAALAMLAAGMML
jgi:hypothetical protein